MEGKNRATFGFIKFFSIYLDWVSCFYFYKITFFINGNAPLILKIFNNNTDINHNIFQMTCFYHTMIFFKIIDYYKLSDIYIRHNDCLGHMLITQVL